MTSQKQSIKSDADPNSISMEAARKIIFSGIPTLTQSISIPVAKAKGRVLANDLHSPVNVPPFRASAMDGYAYRHAEGAHTLSVSARSLAGHPSDDQAQTNECHRITTGARVPDFADTVVQQENVEINDNNLVIKQHPIQGFHVRPAGSDSEKGSLLMRAGQRLAAAQIACLHSHGIVEITVLRRVEVAVFSTGDELVNAGGELKTGQIYDANRALLPGRPLTFGLLNKHQPYFGLPGNPVSAALTCIMFVMPALQTLLQQTTLQLPRINAKLTSELKKLPGRVEYQRGVLSNNDSGEWIVTTTGLQDSHVVSSLHKANCFVELGYDSAGAKTDEIVSVIPFEHFAESIL